MNLAIISDAKAPAAASSQAELRTTHVETTPLPEGVVEDEVLGEENQVEEDAVLEDEDEIQTKEIWIDFDNFCKCFK